MTRILIADDHALFRESLRALVEARGYDVVGEACDGQQAVELARQLQPELVLLDLSMPKLDGLGAARRLREEVPSARVVNHSGFVVTQGWSGAAWSARSRATSRPWSTPLLSVSCGAIAFIAKPTEIAGSAARPGWWPRRGRVDPG